MMRATFKDTEIARAADLMQRVIETVEQSNQSIRGQMAFERAMIYFSNIRDSQECVHDFYGILTACLLGGYEDVMQEHLHRR